MKLIECMSLTDFEYEALQSTLNLADGHAYQGMESLFPSFADELGALWDDCEHTPVREMEERFRRSFALLARSPRMAALPSFKVAPTASNSIDIVAAVLAHDKVRTCLIEPTFDNLALIMSRRGVELDAVDESALLDAVAGGNPEAILDARDFGALFLVHPNNPTGRSMTATGFRSIAEYCAEHHKLLVIDHSFRFFARNPFDDYAILADAGTSFMALEDTGKVWPTHDLKASLLFYSEDLDPLVEVIYNEIYLCHSRFAMGLLTKCLEATSEAGLASTIWAQVDERRALLRSAIAETALVVDETSIDSRLSVEWIDCRATGRSDLELTAHFHDKGLMILPGRQFFWDSSARPDRQFNIRLAMMKPLDQFRRSLDVLRSA